MATLKEAIKIAKTEPDSERSIKLQRGIIDGKFDQIAASEGIDLTNFKKQFLKSSQNLSSPLPSDILMTPHTNPVSSKLNSELEQKGGIMGIASKHIGEQISSIPGGVSNLTQQYAGQGPMVPYNLAKDLTLGLGKKILGTGKEVAKGAGETIVALPTAVSAIGSALKGEGISPEQAEILKGATEQSMKGVSEAVELVPTPMGQFAAGFGKQQTKAIDEGAGISAESIVKGLISGGERAAIVKGIQKGAEKYKDIKQAKIDNQTKKLQKRISPKMTSKEESLAMKEGRVVKGKEGILGGKEPDEILPSKNVIRAEKVIRKYIPDADDIDDFQLTTKISDKIDDIATKLKPKMQNVKIDKGVINSISDKFDDFQNKLTSDPNYVAEEIVGKTMQNNFKKFLDDAIKPVRDVSGKFTTKSLDDVWEIRKAYDSTIPDSVKQATSISSDRLQLQKNLWHQNRGLLNDIIKNSANGLGDIARKAFKDMTSLFEAQNNLIQTVPIDLKGTPNMLSTKNLKKAVIYGGVSAAGLGGLKQLLP